MLGAIYCSSIFPTCSRECQFLVRVMAGGVMHPRVMDEPDTALAQHADAMLREYTGIDSPCLFERVVRAPAAIPQYTIGHRQRVARIRELASALPNLQLLGNSYDAVSVVGQLGRPERGQDAGI